MKLINFTGIELKPDVGVPESYSLHILMQY